MTLREEPADSQPDQDSERYSHYLSEELQRGIVVVVHRGQATI